LKNIVLDYGIGNVHSLCKSFEKIGLSAKLSSDPDECILADRIILPGVGAFRAGMKKLVSKGLEEVVMEHSRRGKPLLGICLGMQMLATSSEEFGHHHGLDLIPGNVIRIKPRDENSVHSKVPVIGWASLEYSRRDMWVGTPLAPLRDSKNGGVYFIHSYVFQADYNEHVLAEYDWYGKPLTAAVSRENIFGTQFHPEKSGKIGLEIIKAFTNL
jgi:glutamine amidotransferase